MFIYHNKWLLCFYVFYISHCIRNTPMLIAHFFLLTHLTYTSTLTFCTFIRIYSYIMFTSKFASFTFHSILLFTLWKVNGGKLFWSELLIYYLTLFCKYSFFFWKYSEFLQRARGNVQFCCVSMHSIPASSYLSPLQQFFLL